MYRILFEITGLTKRRSGKIGIIQKIILRKF